jgi:hypothetical protein
MQHAQLDRQENTAPETPAGVATSASTNAHTAPTGHSQGLGEA